MGRVATLFVATLFAVVGYHASPVLAIRSLRIVSPLQSLTIPDPEVKETAKSSRQRFIPKFRSGLQAEVAARRALAEQRTRQMQAAAIAGDDWAEEAASLDSKRKTLEEKLVERAFDKATAAAEAADGSASTDKSKKNSYQFVGVINPKNEQKPITWYARKKPTDAKWSVRLVHVNKSAIIKDLFNRGKVDLFAKYQNTGKIDEETNTPIITKKYQVRERSWKNMWNFNPKNVFTDSSGMYWRERRLRPGMYTDGVSVYESAYRYRDGRNGMHRLSSFQQFLGSKSISSEEKEKVIKRLKDGKPDIVLEDF